MPNSKNTKPTKKSLAWSSDAGCVQRCKINAREELLKQKFQDIGLDENIFYAILGCTMLADVKKLIGKVALHQKSINKAVAAGYIIEEPILTPAEERKFQREKDFDEELLVRLKAKIGHGRRAQKFKYDYENRGMFNRQLMKLYPVEFLQMPRVRNTLKRLYDSIDISNFELKQKDIDERKPKEMTEREWNAEYEAIHEQEKTTRREWATPRAKKPVQELIEEANSTPHPETESEYSNLDSVAPSDDDCHVLSLRTIQNRKRKALDNYKAAKAKISRLGNSWEDEEKRIRLKAEKKQCKSDYRKYETMEENFGTEDDSPRDEDLEDLTGQSHMFHDDFTGKMVDLNELARSGLSNFYARKGKSVKKYNEEQKLQLALELDQYFGSDLSFFTDLEFMEKKERYKQFKSKVRTIKKGKGKAKPFKLLIEASGKNSELVAVLMEQNFQDLFRHSDPCASRSITTV
jgi:hypothetical protein